MPKDQSTTDVGNDTIADAAGNDTIVAGSGPDTIDTATGPKVTLVEETDLGNDTTGETNQSSSSDEPSAGSSASAALFAEIDRPLDVGVVMQPPTPTVGRTVHYWDDAGNGPYAAIVTAEGPQLTVFRPGRNPSPALGGVVPHVTDRMFDGPAWCWPPGTGEYYQCLPTLRGVFPGSVEPYGVKG